MTHFNFEPAALSGVLFQLRERVDRSGDCKAEDKMKAIALTGLALTVALALSATALAQETLVDKDQMVVQPKPYSTYVDQHFPKRVFFGDTHFHSSLSVDSGMIGNRIDLDQALRFARGEEITTSTGQRARLNRPLDFLVLSDHAEYLGISDLIATGDPALLATDVGKEWYDAVQGGGDAAWAKVVQMMQDFSSCTPRFRDAKLERSVWDKVVNTASKYNEPGTFTALNGYEWSSSPGGDNLHRVVVFRDGPDRVKQILPLSAFDSSDPESLWAFLAGYEEKTGGQVLAIPHNGNISNGIMYAETVNGKNMTRDYAERRAPGSLGTVDRGHPDEGRRRDASFSFA
jgi:hypothetical protein